MSKEKILITGGSGLVGTHLTKLLLNEGYEVVHVSRVKNSKCGVKVFEWNVSKNYLEKGALENVQHIIHLAGEPIVAKKWTEEQKAKIIKSRSATPAFLLKKIKEENIPLKTFVSASGINYYGTETSEHIFTEADPPGKGFVSDCTVEWENAADLFQSVCRVVKFRISMVLDKNEGALPQLASPVQLCFGAALGSGKQYVPWIHIYDLCNLFLFALKNEKINGAYNAVAPEHVNNKTFTKTLALILKKPLWLPNIPQFILKIILGNRSELVLKGSRASCEKIMKEGFEFRFGELEKALGNLYSHRLH
ncbi:MAG: TIGR01777 family oxidoreductase [Bacteroidota bacterium]